MNAHEATPPAIDELSRACIEYVRRALGIELDGTPDTLPILDHYLANVLSDDRAKEEINDLVVSSAGAYFGEVVRRALGHGRWHLEEGDLTGYRLELEHVFLFFNPMGMAREALVSADQPGWMAHLEVLPRDRGLLDQTLARMGDVREDDYYRLAVRFEVIELVVSALEGASVSRKAQDEAFSPAVYAATARALRGESGERGAEEN
ncbi:MAG: hypothetical protein K1X94_02150 [Sandaracinaceae bacterium]|jgi:hypothetical protein|nr:hypothetical protein [Sandaracinaceae bacterium]